MAMRNRLARVAAVLLLLASFGFSAFVVPQNTSGDFLMLWTGARLAGPDLYSWEKAAEIQRAEEPGYSPKGFVRMPLEALALAPLGQVPARTAFRVWQILNLCALIAFVWLWSPRPQAFMAAALFAPAWYSIGLGQETCILLLLLGSGLLLIGRHWDFVGGFLLATCAVKPHLFLFLPVLLLAQKRPRALGGMLAGGTAVYLVSAAITGLDWPIKFLGSIAINREVFHPSTPGLSSAFSQFPVPVWAIVAAETIIAVLVFLMIRRQPWRQSAACVMVISVLFAPWSLLYDFTLMLPAALSALAGEFSNETGNLLSAGRSAAPTT